MRGKHSKSRQRLRKRQKGYILPHYLASLPCLQNTQCGNWRFLLSYLIGVFMVIRLLAIISPYIYSGFGGRTATLDVRKTASDARNRVTRGWFSFRLGFVLFYLVFVLFWPCSALCCLVLSCVVLSCLV
jgi:hypothetical protein